MPTIHVLTFLSRLFKFIIQTALTFGKISKSGILNYYGAMNYAEQNNFQGNLKLGFEIANVTIGFIPTYVLSLASGQKKLKKILADPKQQATLFKNTLALSPVLCVLIMIRCFSDVTTDIKISFPILEDFLSALEQHIPINVAAGTIVLTVLFNGISLFCDTAFNAPSELRLLKSIVKQIKYYLGIPIDTLTFTDKECIHLQHLLSHSAFDYEPTPAEQDACLLTENELLIQRLSTAYIQKKMEPLLKQPTLTQFFKDSDFSEDETQTILDKLTALTFKYPASTQVLAYTIRSIVVLPFIHLNFAKNKEFIKEAAIKFNANEETAQGIALGFGSLIFLLKLVSNYGKPVEYLATALNRPLCDILSNSCNTIKTNSVSLLIGIIASTPYRFFSFEEIRKVASEPNVYWPLIAVYSCADILNYCALVMPRIFIKFHSLDCCSSQDSQNDLTFDTLYQSNSDPESAHEQGETITPTRAHYDIETKSPTNNHQHSVVPSHLIPTRVSHSIPIPQRPPTPNGLSVLSNASPNAGPFHALSTTHDINKMH